MPMRHLVFVPGLLCAYDLYAAQIAALAGDASIQVADHARASTMADIAEDVLAAAPPRFALAGLSMGGYVALEIMRRAPDRVERLALIDTSARPDLPEQSENRRRLVALAEKKGIGVPAQEMYPKLVAPSRCGDERLMAVFLDMAQATGVAAFARQQAAIAARRDSRPSLSSIRCPTLVLVGEHDQLTPPSMAEEMARHITSSRLAVVPGSGHLSPLEEPDCVTAELKAWLQA